MTASPAERLAEELRGATSLNEGVRRAVQRLEAISGCTAGASLIIWDGVGERFIPGATTIPGQAPEVVAQRVRSRGGASRWIVDRRAPFCVRRIENDPFGANPLLAEAGVASYAGIPLHVGSAREVLGVIYLMHGEEVDHAIADIDAMEVYCAAAGQELAVLRALPEPHAADLHVLVVEDDTVLRGTIVNILKHFHGVRVAAAATPAETDRRIAEQRPDLLIIDLELAGESGPALWTRLADQLGDPRPHAWFMTGSARNIDGVRDAKLGIQGTLAKPFGRKRLEIIVNQARAARGGT